MKNILILLGVLSANVFAAEVDTFTNRFLPLEDSSILINQKANAYLKEALTELNGKKKGCNEDALFDKLLTLYRDRRNSKLSYDVYHDKTIARRNIELDQSVYSEWIARDGLGLGVKVISLELGTIAPVLKFGNEYIGADKIEHIFDQGYSYYKFSYKKELGGDAAVNIGMLKEKIFLGGNRFTNGVYSYADLTANFNGMRFWNNILQKEDDLLGREFNYGPYVKCQNNQWVTAKAIDLKVYVDSLMDEAYNCSAFMSGDALYKFQSELEKRKMKCPLNQSKLEQVASKYGSFGKWFINTDGNHVLDFSDEVKK